MKHAVNSITTMYAGFSSAISLNDLRLLVNLGVTELERNVKQEVSISFKIFFKHPPKGCQTDKKEDTICYLEISDIIKEYCNDKEFKLLEYMCNVLYHVIREKLTVDAKLWLKIEKSPPIGGLLGGASFEYTDIYTPSESK